MTINSGASSLLVFCGIFTRRGDTRCATLGLTLFPNGNYGSRMETNNTGVITSAARQNILNYIDQRGTTKAATARLAGIPMTTLDRNLKRPELFTLLQVGCLADALEVTVEDILTSEAVRP